MKQKREKARDLQKNIWLFMLASFVPRMITFFLVPLYTSCLTTEEYGTIDLIATVVGLCLPLFSLQVQDAVLRFSMDADCDSKQVFSVGLRISLLGFLVVTVGVSALWGWKLIALPWEYWAYFLLSYLVGGLNNLFSYFARAIHQVAKVTRATILNTLVTVSCNLLLLLGLRLGWRGYLVANTVGNLAAVAYLFASAKMYRYVTLRRPDRGLVGQIVRFSMPMVFSALAWWVNNSLDKYVLTFFWGASAAGILAVAYKIPTILSVLSSTVSRGFSISAIEGFDEADSDGFLGECYAISSAVMVLGCSALMMMNVPLASFLFAKDFFQAWQTVPPLLISAVFGLMSGICEQIFVAMKRTKLISRTAILGAAVNLVLNFTVIPYLQAYGAAITTAASFFVVWMVRYITVKRHVRLKNHGVKEAVSYGLLLLQMLLAYWGNRYLVVQLILFAAMAVLYIREIQTLCGSLYRSFQEKIGKKSGK